MAIPSTHTFGALGLMSGSSLDGLDIAFCEFKIDAPPTYGLPRVTSWSIRHAATIPYTSEWVIRLGQAAQANGLELCRLNADYGRLVGEMVVNFLQHHELSPDLIASHGHTVFHYPEEGFTLQIGDGAAIAQVTGHRTVVDLRAQDIAAGGQGAPLAPLADALLLPGHRFYLNLGGIANITAKTASGYVAFDICGANQILNVLAAELNLPFDDKGTLARGGRTIPVLLQEQNRLPFFEKAYPKSLDNNWVKEHQSKVFQQHPGSVPDKLNTACQLIAAQIERHVTAIGEREELSNQQPTSMLVSGGGAYNDFLIECIAAALPEVEIVIPEEKIIAFKEAALMALMGCLRVLGLPNCLAGVTGASQDSCGGIIYEMPKPAKV